jgi:hypothetical protein
MGQGRGGSTRRLVRYGRWSQKCDKIVEDIFQLLTDNVEKRDWVGLEIDWSFVDMYGRIDLELDKDLSRLLNILDATPSKKYFYNSCS